MRSSSELKKKMKKFIVITSIFPPTKAVKKYSLFKEYQIVVVADLKTPSNWKYKNVDFISVEKQKKMPYKIIKYLPYNHYCRKMVGYLYAIEHGAEIIVDTDDDNIPLSIWNLYSFTGLYQTISSKSKFINTYKLFTQQHIWPRGFPLQHINSKQVINTAKQKMNVGIWQGLADNDPDVDAIYRMTNNKPCYFNKNSPLVLQKGNVCPFNSQNTAITKDLFPLLYLPGYVTFRFTDILRGLIAQPIMWLNNYHLGFTSATVIQERNTHNYLNDFEEEIPCYLYSEKIIELVSKVIQSKNSLTDNLYNSYEELTKRKITEKREMKLLELWLKDIGSLKIKRIENLKS